MAAVDGQVDNPLAQARALRAAKQANPLAEARAARVANPLADARAARATTPTAIPDAQSLVRHPTTTGEAVQMGLTETAKNISAATGGIDPAEFAAANRVGNYGSWGSPAGPLRSLRLAYPNVPVLGRKPTYDDMELLAQRDKAFATNWAQLKAEKAISEQRGAHVPPERYSENQARLVYENLRKAKAATPGPTEPLPDFETFKQDYNRSWHKPNDARGAAIGPAKAPYLEPSEPKHPGSYYDQYAGESIPGITRPPLTNDEITQMAWDRIVSGERQRIQQNHPMAWAEEGLGAAGQMAATLGASEAIAPLRGAGALVRGITHGAMSDVAAQALEVGSGKRKAIDPVQTAISSAIFGGATKVGEVVGNVAARKLGPRGAEFVEDYGARGQRLARAEAAGKMTPERVARLSIGDQAAIEAIQSARSTVNGLATGTTLTLNEVANIARERMAASGSGHDPEPLMQRLIRGFLAIGVGHFAGIGKGGIPEEEQIARVREARVTKDQAEQVLKKVQEEIGNREQRRSELQTAMEPPPAPNALDQAKAAITRDIKSNPKSIEMMAHPEYAQRIAEQFGLDAEQSKELAQHALEVATAPVHGPPMQPRETVPQTVPQGEPVKPGEILKNARRARKVKDKSLVDLIGDVDRSEARSGREELLAAMEPPPTPNALDQAKAAIERDIRVQPKAVEMLAHPDYVGRIAEMYGLDRAQRTALKQHALEVATRPAMGPAQSEAKAPATEPVPQTVPQGEPVVAEKAPAANPLAEARAARRPKEKSLVDLISDVDRAEAKGRSIEYLASGLHPAALPREANEPNARDRYKAYKATAESMADRAYGSFGEGLGRHVRDFLMKPRTPADQREFALKHGEKFNKIAENLSREQRKVQWFIEKVSRGDPQRAKDVERLFFLETERDNPHPSGSGEKQGIPESQRAWYEAEKAKYRADLFAEGKRLWKDYGRAALEVGEMAEKVNIFPTAILKRDTAPGEQVDQKSLFFRDIKEGSLQAELDAGYKLIGGAEFFRQAGHYLTHGYDFAGGKTPTNPGFFRRLPSSIKQLVAYRSKAFQQAMKRRSLTLGEAIDKGLKMSTEETAIRLAVELDSIAKKELLDHFRSTKAVRLEDDANGIHELPHQVDIEAERKKQLAIEDKMDRLRKEMADRKAAIQKLMKDRPADALERVTALTEKQVEATEMLRNLRSERVAARLSADVAGWSELKDPAFGEYASQENGKRWFIRNDLLAMVGPKQRYAIDPYLRVGGAVMSLAKMFKTGLGQPLRLFTDALTNFNEMREAGYSALSKEGAKEFGRAKWLIFRAEVLGEREKINDPMLDQYEAATRNSSFGGPGDIAQHDQATVAKYRKQLERALRDDIAGDIIASGAELTAAKLNAFLDKPPKWLNYSTGGLSALYGVGREIYRAMTDKADGLFIYTMASKYGPDGSGPMEPHEAAAEVRHVFDMRDQAKWVRTWRMIDSFAPYPVKKIESYLNSAILEPRFFGARIPTPLDKRIWSNPGTPEASRALVARGAMRLGLQVAEKALLVAGVTKLALSAQGKPGESEEDKKRREAEWDKQLDALYTHSARPTAAMMKLFTIPLGKGPDGQQRVMYLDFAMPWMATMRHFTTDDRVPFLRKIATLNVLAADALPAIAGTSWTNDFMRDGFGPGSRNWPILSTLLPVALADADEILMKMIRDPRWREDIAWELAKYFSQAKLFEVKSNASLRAEEEIRRYEAEGKIVYMENKETGGKYPVISKSVPRTSGEYEGIKAWLLLSRIPTTADELRMDILRNMQDFRMNQFR